MTLTVEDGTGLADADSYVSEADCTAYLALHYTSTQLTAWTAASSGDREIWIRNSAQFLFANYRGSWTGQRANELQALDWPRCGARDADDVLIEDDVVPQLVKDAQCELALRASAAALVADVAPSSGSITSESKSGAGFSKSVSYGPGGKSTQTEFTLVDRLLSTLVSDGSELARG